MKTIRSLFLASAVTLITAGLSAPAHAEAWPPPDAVHVSAVKVARLLPDGTVLVGARIRCAPEWEAADLTAQVDRSLTDYAQGITQPDIACDNRWHRVGLTASTVSGKVGPGRVTITVQFTVTHVEFGDAAGAHDATRGRLVRACR